jgi:hypothetical protein
MSGFPSLCHLDPSSADHTWRETGRHPGVIVSGGIALDVSPCPGGLGDNRLIIG